MPMNDYESYYYVFPFFYVLYIYTYINYMDSKLPGL